MNIGIIGLGFVGNAIHQYFKNTNKLFIYDKYKNINSFNTIINTDILFVCLPTLFCDKLNNYDMTEIDITLELLNNNYKGIIIIKSTITPEYAVNINNQYKILRVIHNPEFLSAKTAVEDFANQKHIILGHTEQSINCVNSVKYFYLSYFPTATISIVSSVESSLVKLSCNSFYACKIQFFTEIYLLCEKLNVSYTSVKELMLKNNWINPMHTDVPGHDNMLSFGGACFPKDISALNQYLIKNNTPNMVINAAITERNKMRK